MSISNGKRIRWSDEELGKVAAEAARKFAGQEKITIEDFLECQSVLPFERRRPSINYSTKCKLLALVKAKPAKRGEQSRRDPAKTAERKLAFVPPAAVATMPAISPDGFVDSLSRQIESVVIGVSAKALELAAQRLRANMPPTPA